MLKGVTLCRISSVIPALFRPACADLPPFHHPIPKAPADPIVLQGGEALPRMVLRARLPIRYFFRFRHVPIRNRGLCSAQPVTATIQPVQVRSPYLSRDAV